MANNYYSGQGSLYIAKRDVATGAPLGLIAVGNVPELTIDIEVDKFEHKESESGSRLLDMTVVKEKKGKFKFKLENLNLDNLALGLFGDTATVAAGTVAVGSPEVIKIPMGAKNMRFPLAFPKVSAVVVKDSTGVTTHTVATDYTVDADNGVLILGSTGAIVTAAAATDITIKVSYTYAGHMKLEAFTQSAAPERYLRFEGLNTIDNSRVVLDIFRAQFDPMTGYSLINDELGSVDMTGYILADALQSAGSKFFRQRNF